MQPGSSLHAALLAQHTLPVAEIDSRTGTVRQANAALAALAGRLPGELTQHPFAELLVPGDRAAFAALLGKHSTPAPHPCHLLAAAGAPRAATLTLPAPDRPGKDHTARLILVELQAVAESFAAPQPIAPPADATPASPPNIFRHIVLAANEGIWTVDAGQHTTFVNQRMADMLGYTTLEMRGRLFTDFLFPEDLLDHAAQIARRLRGESDRYERRLRRNDGSPLWALVAGTPLLGPDHQYHGSFGLFSDITERKRADHALALSEERYRSLLAAATDYVFTVPYVDGHAGATIHGPGCVKVTGYEPREYDADPFLWYRMIDPADRDVVERHIQRVVAGERADTIEHRLLHRDGAIRWVRHTLVPRRDPAGVLLSLDGLVTDITERTLALQQLRERETLYRAVIETSVDGFWIADPAGRILEVNDAYIRRSGYTRAELLALRIQDLEAAESPAEAAAHIARIRRDGFDLFESRHRAKDGTIWQAEVNVTHWPIGDGRLFVFIRDILRRKRSEALLHTRLQLSELARHGDLDRLLQAALDAAELRTGSTLGFFHFVDPDQNHLTRQTWSTNTLRNQPPTENHARPAPADPSAAWAAFLRPCAPVVLNDYAAQPDKQHLLPDHAQLQRVLTVPILRDDRIAALIGVGNKTTAYTPADVEAVQELADVAMDFVQRLQAEQSLRRSEHQLRLIIDTVPALIAYIDTGYRYRLLNETFHLWFGDPIATILARAVPQQVGPAAWAELQPLIDRALAGETVVYEKEIPLGSAGRRWLHGFYTPDRDESGRVRGVVVLANDITPRKQLEEQLLRAQRLEVVGRLASGVAHDLNNILQPVLMAPRLLRPALSDPEALGLVDTIEGSVRRGAEIIRQLLAFGRGAEVRRVPLRLDTLLADLCRILRETLPKNIVLHCELPPHSHPVQADATQIHQVLMNLCLNARDAMRAGGVLHLRLAPAEFAQPLADAVPAGRTGRFQVISVADTGSGIDPAHLPKLFDPFFTTKDVGEGTGLGLSTVLGIVRSHEGFLHVASTIDRGSTFRVFLPETDTTPAPKITPVPEPACEGQRRHVLVVDDEAPVRDLICRVLLRHDFRVSEAANGAEALVMIAQRENAIDLVIADMLMPVMDGSTLIRELHRRHPRLPIVAISGHLATGPVDPEIHSAIRALLPKPFDTAQLLAAIRLPAGTTSA